MFRQRRFAMTLQVTVTASGRMSLPADIRKRLGLAQGGAVYVDETDDALREVVVVLKHECEGREKQI